MLQRKLLVQSSSPFCTCFIVLFIVRLYFLRHSFGSFVICVHFERPKTFKPFSSFFFFSFFLNQMLWAAGTACREYRITFIFAIWTKFLIVCTFLILRFLIHFRTGLIAHPPERKSARAMFFFFFCYFSYLAFELLRSLFHFLFKLITRTQFPTILFRFCTHFLFHFWCVHIEIETKWWLFLAMSKSILFVYRVFDTFFNLFHFTVTYSFFIIRCYLIILSFDKNLMVVLVTSVLFIRRAASWTRVLLLLHFFFFFGRQLSSLSFILAQLEFIIMITCICIERLVLASN